MSSKKQPVSERDRVEESAGDMGAVSSLSLDSRFFINISLSDEPSSSHSGSDSSLTTRGEGQAADLAGAAVDTHSIARAAWLGAAATSVGRASARACSRARAVRAASLPHFFASHFWCSTILQFQMSIPSATDPHTMLPTSGSPILIVALEFSSWDPRGEVYVRMRVRCVRACVQEDPEISVGDTAMRHPPRVEKI